MVSFRKSYLSSIALTIGALCVWLALAGPVSAAEIWIEHTLAGADFPSQVWVWASGVEEPIRAVQFGLDLPLEVSCLNNCERGDGVDRFRWNWPDCWTPPAGWLQLDISYFWCVGDCSVSATDTICIGAGAPTEIDPPAPAYQRCDGTWVPFTIVASPHGAEELPVGCAIAYSNVPLNETSWGCVKALYRDAR